MITDYNFRAATISEAQAIWEILEKAIERRKADGSNQWQDGYPNPLIVENDILSGSGYVLLDNDKVIGYLAVFINDEPEYANIVGQWLTNGDFIAVHRVAVSSDYIGKGIAKQLMTHVEGLALSKGINSIKADTNFDNGPMIHIFEKLGYVLCGEVYFRGAPRKAFEKVLR